MASRYFIKQTNPYEIAILRLLRLANRPLTTSQIAQRTGMSWKTAKKYLEKMRGKKVRRQKKGNKIFWHLR
ncbi:MAG: winged helix-turn-helix transcriptional regulator [Candidatus Helarchaeota archaeon]